MWVFPGPQRLDAVNKALKLPRLGAKRAEIGPNGPEYHAEYVLNAVDNSQLKQQSFTWNGSSIEDTSQMMARRDIDRRTVSTLRRCYS